MLGWLSENELAQRLGFGHALIFNRRAFNVPWFVLTRVNRESPSSWLWAGCWSSLRMLIAMSRLVVGSCSRLILPRWLLLLVITLWGCGHRNEQTDAPAASRIESKPTSQSMATASKPGFQFVDRAAECGINFVARNGQEAGHLAILETLGAGVALLDFDADGTLDIFAVGGGEFDSTPAPVGLPLGLFRQIEPWRFENNADRAGCQAVSFYAHGAAVADFDNDGFRDILVTGYHGLELFQNLGDGTFIPIANRAGLLSDRWSTSAAWVDINGDGMLDLYVVNYVDWSFAKHPECEFFGKRDVCAPKSFEAQSDVLWLSRGDGTFEDFSERAGLQSGGKGLAVLAADLDVDGDVDLYVANDTTPNLFYRNDGAGHFTEVGIRSGTALGEGGEADGSMGVDVCDFNLDGLPDLWVSNYENQTYALYRNDGHGLFQHVSSVSGISTVGRLFVGFGTAAADFDLDGDEDLIATNGHVMRTTSIAPHQQRALLFENLGGGHFREVAESAGPFFSEPHMGRGLAVGDLDGDCDVDVVIAHMNHPLAVLENRSTGKLAPTSVRLIGTKSARDAIGARLLVPLEAQKQTVRLVKSGGSYLSTSSYDIAGLATSAAQSLRVAWPNSGREHAEHHVGNVRVWIER